MRNRVVTFLVGLAVLFSCALAAGPKWIETAGPHGGRVNALIVSGTNLFAGSENGLLYVSRDNGDTWSAVSVGLPKDASVRSLAVVGADLFAGTSKGIFLSTDNGASWAPRNSGLPKNLPVMCLAVMGADVFAGGKGGVFCSMDNGTTWTARNSGLPKDNDIICFAVNGANLFVGTTHIDTASLNLPTTIFLSTDKGVRWAKASSGFPSGALLHWLAANGTNVFAGTLLRGVLRFNENDKKWSAARSGIPDTEINCFAANSTDLFVGTGGGLDVYDNASLTGFGGKSIILGQGVFRSTDNGKKWSAVNSGLPLVQTASGKKVGTFIECLVLNETYLFAATREGIVWRLPLKDLPAK